MSRTSHRTAWPLYLRIWLAVVGAVVVITLAFAWLWRADFDERPGNARIRGEREILLRDETGQVLGRTRSRPVFVPGHGIEFAVPLDDGRTVIVHMPPRERPGDEERTGSGSRDGRNPASGDARGEVTVAEAPRFGEPGMHRPPGVDPGMHRGAPLPAPPPSRPWLRGTSGLLWMLAAVALAVALGSYPIIRRLTLRLEALRAGVERWGEGDLKARVDESGHDEAAVLARRFNHAAARIEQLVQSHKSLLANASHELRSPLARIRMGLALLGPQADARARAEIERNIAELDLLVEEILLASRLDMSGADLGPTEAVDLIGLAAEECARTGASLQVQGTGGSDAAASAAIVVQGQPRLLRRVLRNLLENAARHGAGEVVMELGIERGVTGLHAAAPHAEAKAEAGRSADTRASAVLRVRDHGPGVPAAERERIFEPFYRLPGASEQSGGVGLGLALVRSIMQRHGGSVRCEDNPGGGACFVVQLPLTVAPDPA